MGSAEKAVDIAVRYLHCLSAFSTATSALCDDICSLGGDICIFRGDLLPTR
jgi:hypothetical protein